MHLWAWLRHPRLSFYQYRRKHHDIPIDPRKEERIDQYDLHQRYPGVTDFLLSQQSLVTYEHVGPAQADHQREREARQGAGPGHLGDPSRRQPPVLRCDHRWPVAVTL
jgi:hypothetical protein